MTDERGVAVVELAVILPAFLLILLGVMDFGKVFNYWESTTQAAAVGARAGAVDNWPSQCRADVPPVITTSCTLQQWIRSQLRTRELYENANVCVAFPDPVGTGGDVRVGNRITVQVKVPYDVPLVSALSSALHVNIRGTATMRIEVDSSKTGAVAISPSNNIGSCT